MRNPSTRPFDLGPRATPFPAPRAKHKPELLYLIGHSFNLTPTFIIAMINSQSLIKKQINDDLRQAVGAFLWAGEGELRRRW